jgi:hypothetical protein
VDAGVRREEGRPAREGGRIVPAELGRDSWVVATVKEATEAAVEGRDGAAARERAAGTENMDCQVMPSEQSLGGEGEGGEGGGGGAAGKVQGGDVPALQELWILS